jgi:hypothetical protein
MALTNILAVLLPKITAQSTEVIVIVVLPMFGNTIVVNVPVVPLKVIEPDWPVAMFAPVRL